MKGCRCPCHRHPKQMVRGRGKGLEDRDDSDSLWSKVNAVGAKEPSARKSPDTQKTRAGNLVMSSAGQRSGAVSHSYHLASVLCHLPAWRDHY